MKEWFIGLMAWCVFVTIILSWGWSQRGDAEHDIAAHFYHHCRENLGLFEPMTTLAKGESACSHLIQEELGIENRWKEELP